MRSVIVTGGAGYIGAHACKALAIAGWRPVAYDNLSIGRREFVKWGPLIEADTRDPISMERAIREYDAVAVMHFAALSSVAESQENPALYYDNNVRGLLGVLEGIRSAGRSRIVFSSTASVYGQPDGGAINEDTPTAPINTYGHTKLMCERLLADYARSYGLKYVSLRYFNACGADSEAEIGEQREVETHLIPRAMMSLQGHLESFQVFGNDFQTRDGTAIRDYVHVSDLADAHVAALERLEQGRQSGIFNLGSGHGHSVAEVLKAISATTGRSFVAPSGQRRPGDPSELVASIERARSELGFDPVRSTLPNIVETAWRWHQQAHPARVTRAGALA
ncbi:UDP-glucose 4-epimerase GalE [Caulobacter segnis]|uniref:UDP-glucose 4-epimerase GalE n=1 Tax=Caulobacter segnis TaxID=88688 RepID=UPI00240FB02B|nr:UDP-glucose 4-epimerase GalE [Caulobacter segnis]MDG2520500.1 UDP-glucose 4-epimerase GalE [Caulobacter segnis]